MPNENRRPSLLVNLLTLGFISPGWRIAVFIALGIVVGMSVVVARMANVTSYMNNEPETCINCHVMDDSYATWRHGSHANVAVCNDCHVPQDNFIASWAFKSQDGMKHSYVFALRNEPQVLHLSPEAVQAVQGNCIRCHSDQIQMIRTAELQERNCWDCHQNIHGQNRSISGSPHSIRPDLPSVGWDKD